MSGGGWTKGPWSVDEKGDIVSGPYNVCIPYAMTPADKALAAAAPELLEALIAAVDCGLVPKSSAADGGANKHLRQVEVADMIRAAIAKATAS